PRFGGWVQGFAEYGKRCGTTVVAINWPIDDGLSCNYNNWGGNQRLAEATIDGMHAHDNFQVSWGFRSKHPGGANFAFVDGSVHFIRQTIDHKTYQHLGCKNDGQALGDY